MNITPEELDERRELLVLAKAEHQAIKEARQKGEPIPATPAIDALHKEHENMTTTKKATKTTGEGRTKGRTDIRYFHDGRSMPESHKHKLSTVAYFYSSNLKGGVKRIGTAEFIAVLKELGVSDPGQPGWMVKLPNGITIECRVDGEASEFTGPKGEKRPTSKASKRQGQKIPESLKAGLEVLADEPSTSSSRAKADVVPNPKPAASKVSKSARAAAVKAANPKKAPAAKKPAAKKQPTKKATTAKSSPGPRSVARLLP